MKKRTKLDLTDTQQLLELCLNECYFICNNVIWTQGSLRPIGLSIMVVLSECDLQKIGNISITQALIPSLAIKTSKDLLMIAMQDLTIENNHYSF